MPKEPLMESLDADSFVPCAGGHWFLYAGDPPGGRLPDGYPCQCGATQYDRRQAILAEIDALQRELEEA